jgi:hypothetical protein
MPLHSRAALRRSSSSSVIGLTASPKRSAGRPFAAGPSCAALSAWQRRRHDMRTAAGCTASRSTSTSPTIPLPPRSNSSSSTASMAVGATCRCGPVRPRPDGCGSRTSVPARPAINPASPAPAHDSRITRPRDPSPAGIHGSRFPARSHRKSPHGPLQPISRQNHRTPRHQLRPELHGTPGRAVSHPRHSRKAHEDAER